MQVPRSWGPLDALSPLTSMPHGTKTGEPTNVSSQRSVLFYRDRLTFAKAPDSIGPTKYREVGAPCILSGTKGTVFETQRVNFHLQFSIALAYKSIQEK